MDKRTAKRPENDGKQPIDAETEWTQVAQRHYDPDGNMELTTAIVYALADAKEINPRAVKSPPIYECIDVPAMEDAFFGPDGAAGSRQGIGSVTFRYADYQVEVQSDGWIQVSEQSESGAPA